MQILNKLFDVKNNILNNLPFCNIWGIIKKSIYIGKYPIAFCYVLLTCTQRIEYAADYTNVKLEWRNTRKLSWKDFTHILNEMMNKILSFIW